ncbi:hypothetical protein ACFYQA_27465 [Streptomyces sp. NPDC005774]|uniref:hypothetical protein n=1 Tax=Streptomyces sp. NPDC005774 TaxID=3364728 RepID=UPI0036AD37DD
MKHAAKLATKSVLTLLLLTLGSSLLFSSPAEAADWKPTAKASKTQYVPTPVLPTRPCRDDSDDRNCYWDAAKRGNGKGYSYWVDRAGNVKYLDPKLNSPAKRKAWKQENQKLKREYWGTVWGHRLCWAKVGNTTYIYCFDGHRETT